jgi:hypothetical protein
VFGVSREKRGKKKVKAYRRGLTLSLEKRGKKKKRHIEEG